MVGTFGQKPSETHVVWTNREEEGKGKKRFDFDYLERWANHIGADYEERTRVDHQRSETPRQQHAVVFEWVESADQTIELGDSSWNLGGGKTPRTFLEIDEAGMALITGWNHETTVDLREMWIDGPNVRMKTAEEGMKSLDIRKLVSED